LVAPSTSLSDPRAAQIFEQARALIASQTGIPAEKISLRSRFEEDLRIAGDDAIELIDRLFADFNIAPGDFNYGDYVSAEGLSLLGDSASAKRKPMTVAMWVKAAIDGAWSNPSHPS
jgi:acyl carrier protein